MPAGNYIGSVAFQNVNINIMMGILVIISLLKKLNHFQCFVVLVELTVILVVITMIEIELFEGLVWLMCIRLFDAITHP